MSDRSELPADESTIVVGMPYEVLLDIEDAITTVVAERNTSTGTTSASSVDALTGAVSRFIEAARADGEPEFRSVRPDDEAHRWQWKVTEVWTMSSGETYMATRGYFDQEPRSGDLMFQVLQPAVDRLDQARLQGTALMFIDTIGSPVALRPALVASVEIQLTGPDGLPVSKIAPGHLRVDGPVERDEEGFLR